ncbi:MAG: hypothetical protein VW879_15890, partial [Opitutae bacterium]
MASIPLPKLTKSFPALRKGIRFGLVLLSLASPAFVTAQQSTPIKKQELLTIVQRHEKLLFQYSDDPNKFERKNLN